MRRAIVVAVVAVAPLARAQEASPTASAASVSTDGGFVAPAPALPAVPEAPPPPPPPPAAIASTSGSGVLAPAATATPLPSIGTPALVVCAVTGRAQAPVIGATVILVFPDGRAAAGTAGSDGCATFPLLPAGTYKVTVAAPGSKPADFPVAVPAVGGVKKVVSLEVATAATQEFTVEASREKAGETRRTIEPEIARTVPGTQGDALKVVQDLPGTARSSFGSGALIVRGAAPGDTRVFLDGQEIPQLYHFGGLVSVVSTEVLSSIDFLPGGFGVRYGRATAGVVDVETRGGHEDHTSGLIDASIYNTEAEIEGPIGEGAKKGRYVAAGRRSYIDAILPAVVPSDQLALTVAPRFYDYQLRYDAPTPASGTKTHLLAYGSDDAFTFVVKKPVGDAAAIRGTFLFRTLFHRLQAPVAQPLSGGWVLSLTPGLGYQAVTIDVGSLAYLQAARTDATLRAEVRGPVAPGVRLLVGFDGVLSDDIVHLKFPDFSSGDLSSLQRTKTANERYTVGEEAVYTEAEIDLGRGVTLVPGLRLDGYTPPSALSFDPRVAARWQIDPDRFLKAYAGIYHQPPDVGQWDPQVGNPHLRLPYALQLGVGGGQKFGTTSVSGELFWKWLDDLVAQAPADPGDPATRSHYDNRQIGRAYGLEVLVKRELSEKIYGWIAYTLSRSERADPYTPDGWHPFDYDQTHILTLILGWKLPRDWEAGVRFRYTSGNPYTGVAGAIYDADNDNYIQLPGRTNGARLPDFQQLDIRFDKRWQFDHWKLGAYLDVQNVYAQPNPEGIDYDYNFKKRYYVTGLPVLPLIGLRAEF